MEYTTSFYNFYNKWPVYLTPGTLSLTTIFFATIGTAAYFIPGGEVFALTFYTCSALHAAPVATWGVLSASKYLFNVVCVKKQKDGLGEEDELDEEDAQELTKENTSLIRSYLFSDECEQDLVWTSYFGAIGTVLAIMTHLAAEKNEVIAIPLGIMTSLSLLIATIPVDIHLLEYLCRETPVELVGEIEPVGDDTIVELVV